MTGTRVQHHIKYLTPVVECYIKALAQYGLNDDARRLLCIWFKIKGGEPVPVWAVEELEKIFNSHIEHCEADGKNTHAVITRAAWLGLKRGFTT